MAAPPMKTGLPPDCVLSAGYIVRLAAINPTTGAAVAGVQLSDVSFFVTDLISAPGSGDQAPMPLLVPSDQTV
jgi:hypothetical protein